MVRDATHDCARAVLWHLTHPQHLQHPHPLPVGIRTAEIRGRSDTMTVASGPIARRPADSGAVRDVCPFVVGVGKSPLRRPFARPSREGNPLGGVRGPTSPARNKVPLDQTSGSNMISRTSWAQRQAAANLVAHSSPSSREATSTMAKPPMTAFDSG